MTQPPHPIATLIKEAAVRRGVTMRALAAEAFMSHDTLYRLMKGEAENANMITIYRLARAMGIAPIALLRVMHHDIDLGPATALPVDVVGDHSAFVADVTYPDGDVVRAGQRFVKRWLLQNTGRVAWRGRVLRCMDGDIVMARRNKAGELMLLFTPGLKAVESQVPVPDTKPGQTVEIAAEFIAPELPCDVLSSWKMHTASGKLCFPEHSGIWCRVTVMAA